MLNSVLADFYERDIRKLIEEVNLFNNEANLWKTEGSVRNTSGNLVLHILGNLNHFIGSTLGGTGYVRDRDGEFTRKGVPKKDLVAGLEELIPIVRKTVAAVNLDDAYPLEFAGANRSNGYMIVHLLAHLNYHLGQVNYLRRILEQEFS